MKKELIISTAVTALVFSACSGDNSTNFFLQNDEEYQQCIALMNDNPVDEDGHYIYDMSDIENEREEIPEGAVKVFFADNNTLKFNYYLDEEHKQPIDTTQSLYIHPGDKIYASAWIDDDNKSFDKFVIYKKNKDNDILIDDSIMCSNSDTDVNNLTVLSLTDNYEYNEIIVVPYGKFKDRNIKLNAYTKDSDGNMHNVNLSWQIETIGKETRSVNNSEVDVDPFEQYIISLDLNGYDFVNSEPSPFKNENGIVQFWMMGSTDFCDEYNVELSQKANWNLGSLYDLIGSHFSVSIYDKDGKTIYDGRNDTEESQKNMINQGGRCTVGGRILLTPKNGFEDFDLLSTLKNANCNLSNLRLTERTDDGIWVLEVSAGNSIQFDPNKFKYENGSVTFFDSNGIKITEATTLDNGSQIIIESFPNDSSYHFSKGDGKQEFILNSLYWEYELKNMCFTKSKKIELIQPEKGGKVVYKFKGNIIPEGTESILYNSGSGDKLEIDSFIPDIGYVPVVSPGEIIFEENSVEIKLEGKKVNEFFTLDSLSKITVKKNVSSDIRIIMNNTPLEKDKITENIATVEGINFTFSNINLDANKVLKFSVNAKDLNGKTHNYISYLPANQQQLELPYDKSILYKEMTINISCVDIVQFDLNSLSVENATISNVEFSDCENDTAITNGTITDSSRTIRLTIVPDDGYTVYKKSVVFFIPDSAINGPIELKFSKLSDLSNYYCKKEE